LSRRLFLTTLFTTLSIPAAHAQSEVRLYGLVDVGLETSKTASGRQQRIFSGGLQGSRWGLLGSEDLGGGVKANFRLESGFTADDGQRSQGGRAFGRESSVGLSSASWGGINLGRLPVPYYLVQNGVDAFGWGGNGSLVAITRAQAGAVRQVLPAAVNARDDNSIAWVSPKWGGLVLRAQKSFNESSPTLGNSVGLSARYSASAWDLVTGWHRQKAGTSGTGEVEAQVVGGSYNFGPIRMYAGYTQETNSCTNCTGPYARISGAGEADFRVFNLGARVPLGQTFLIGQVARVQDRSSYTANADNRDATWVALGLEHFLSKRTALYTSIGTLGNSNGSSYVLGTGSSQQPAGVTANPSRTTTFAAGIRHTF
jgi:predicted porin